MIKEISYIYSKRKKENLNLNEEVKSLFQFKNFLKRKNKNDENIDSFLIKK